VLPEIIRSGKQFTEKLTSVNSIPGITQGFYKQLQKLKKLQKQNKM